ncbi:MAG TPA: tetratricopeptide repeat protein [Opitutaceae bacterium]|nr:tetratricopeptide repeat protein [Opitutaceae bacterium]
MNAPSPRRWIAIAAALAVVGVGSFFIWRHVVKPGVAIVELPPVKTWPQPFVSRLKAADSDARAGSFTALVELSRLYHANAFYPQAIDCYKKLIALEPKNGRWPRLLSVASSAYGQLDHGTARAPDSEESWKSDLIDDCYDIDRLTSAAAAYASHGNMRKAEDLLRRAISYRPDNDSTHRTLGQLLDQTGAFPEAEKELRRALELAPREPKNFLQLGLMQSHAGDDDAAEKTLRQGVTIAPADYTLRYEHGSLLLSLDRFDEAIPEFEEAQKLRPEKADIHFALAGALIKSGRNERAAEELKRTLELQPDYPLALLTLARVAVMDGNEALARELYGRVTKQSGVPRDARERLRELFQQRFHRAP